MEIETIKINEVEYVRKDSISEKEPDLNGMECCIVRTYLAGVFYGYIEKRECKEVTMRKARRMWQWFGASLSQCAQSGTPDKSKCKCPEYVDKVILTECIEILTITKEAKKSLDEVIV